MRTVYICSPYKAKDGEELDRHIEYAQELTRQAIKAGLAPITPHLYMTQCVNEDKPEERAASMAAGLELLKVCDFVIVGVKYGISWGMSREMQAAACLGIEIVDADKLAYQLTYDCKQEEEVIESYAKLHACNFCKGKHFHTCSLFSCEEPYKRAYEYAEKHYNKGVIRE